MDTSFSDMTTKEQFWTLCEGLRLEIGKSGLLYYRNELNHLVIILDKELNTSLFSLTNLKQIFVTHHMDIEEYLNYVLKFLIAEVSNQTKSDFTGEFLFNL